MRLRIVLLALVLLPPIGVCADAGGGIGEVWSVREIPGISVTAVRQDRMSLAWCRIDSVSQWKAVQMPDHIFCQGVVGGSSARTLILTYNALNGDGDPSGPVYDLQSIDNNLGAVTTVASRIGSVCDFFDDQIGCRVKKESATKATVSVEL